MQAAIPEKARDRPKPEGWRRATAIRYAIEVISSAIILLWVYGLIGAPGVIWAVITAILVLQPGLDRSMSASKVRIIATMLGAIAGTGAVMILSGATLALLAGILVTVVLCYCARLDLHMRQACLTVPIVQMGTVPMTHLANESVLQVSIERISAILAGCVVPLLVQYSSEHWLGLDEPKT